jgi:hypothetical protein
LGKLPEQPAAASGGWTSDDTFNTKLCFYETPFIVTVQLKFTGDEVKCSLDPNVALGSAKAFQLTGKAE